MPSSYNIIQNAHSTKNENARLDPPDFDGSYTWPTLHICKVVIYQPEGQLMDMLGPQGQPLDMGRLDGIWFAKL